MALSPGGRLGLYEILSPLGAGGMGEVYHARDTRLGRSVAVKILPTALAHDAERIARFEREARVLAALNHPNIATLFGFEECDGVHFLVMELVDGSTLADRIARGPIPVTEALTIARQIADALEAAHAKDIVHRDLKPANVKIAPDGKVKVLDFGLAKALAATSAPADFLSSPTIAVAGTYAGVVLGTAPYMSPEQARGQDVDQRTDVFAFGCVLFEMLTGRRSFQGDTATEAIASVLAREPEMTALPSGINPRIAEVLRRCLEKDPKRRWQAIGDVRVELDALAEDPHGLKTPRPGTAPVPLWKFIVPALATGVLGAAATAMVLRSAPPAHAPTMTRFAYPLPHDQSFTRAGRHVISISPDGTNIVYVANLQLYLKPMGEFDAKPIAGTSVDVDTPFFSPDGKWIAFYSVSDSKLKKVLIDGGPSVALADLDNPFGASWTAADQILVGQGPKGIVRVPAAGGKTETIITVAPGELAQSPQLLPDGDHVLFTIGRELGPDRWDKARIVVQSIRSGQRTVLVEGGSDGRYAPTGHIVYAVGTTVFALPFNVRALTATGTAVPVLEGVGRAAINTGAAFFAFSDGGTLAMAPSDASVTTVSLALVNRNGDKKLLALPPQPYGQPRISPDGRQLAVEIDDGKQANIWVYELSGATALRRLTFAGRNIAPVWDPSGERIAFASDREGGWSIFSQRADGNGAAQRLTVPETGINVVPESWSPDGRTLTFSNSISNGSGSIRMIGITGGRSDGKSRALVETPRTSIADQSALSPDGRWITYEVGTAAGSDIYVQPFPPTGATYQVAAGVCRDPAWTADGKQIAYVDNQNGGRTRFLAVDVQTQSGFAVGTPTPLRIEGFAERGSGRPYDVMPDGKQFLMVLPAVQPRADTLRINVVLNWFQDLQRRAPAK